MLTGPIVRVIDLISLRCDERIEADRGRIALRYGPMIYNVEKADQPDILVLQTDPAGSPIVNPVDPERYLLKYIDSEAGTVLPTIGIIIEI